MVTVSGVDADGNPFVQTAYARDVSSSGARLDGLALLKSSGQTIEVEHRGKSAKFVVAWTGEPGRPQQGQVGIRSLDPKQNIWKIDLPRSGPDNFEGAEPQSQPSAHPSPAQVSAPPPTPRSSERRRGKRYPGKGMHVEFRAPGAVTGMHGRLTDIGLAGCYIELLSPCLQGTTLEVVVPHQGSNICLPGRVVTVHPGMGMGIVFEGLDSQNLRALASLIEALSLR